MARHKKQKHPKGEQPAANLPVQEQEIQNLQLAPGMALVAESGADFDFNAAPVYQQQNVPEVVQGYGPYQPVPVNHDWNQYGIGMAQYPDLPEVYPQDDLMAPQDFAALAAFQWEQGPQQYVNPQDLIVEHDSGVSDIGSNRNSASPVVFNDFLKPQGELEFDFVDTSPLPSL